MRDVSKESKKLLVDTYSRMFDAVMHGVTEAINDAYLNYADSCNELPFDLKCESDLWQSDKVMRPEINLIYLTEFGRLKKTLFFMEFEMDSILEFSIFDQVSILNQWLINLVVLKYGKDNFQCLFTGDFVWTDDKTDPYHNLTLKEILAKRRAA